MDYGPSTRFGESWQEPSQLHQTQAATYNRVSYRRRYEVHYGFFLIGLDTTTRPQGCLGSTRYPAGLVKISDEAWYRTEGVPLWQ